MNLDSRRLQSLASSARMDRPAWDEARAERVLSSTIALRDRRAERAKVFRRSLVAMSSVTVVVLLLLRGAGASTSAVEADTDLSLCRSRDGVVAASIDAYGDGGYRHD